ncbi:D-alanyl-lipoteichoic acid acyltransferase DltB, MBOAT superfamily [Gracilibacillus ureilyticus]|uniref:D-alanyl-lipoteichoic acid acyltransferase DltB, MBOAT superfamily n=1 Tax=Gracilibacillus ureilyticus TaxID=531814 RepID=A0A1H9RCL6_9BACI|nr:MBOAT family protein [Gracilibacillus ureilyticus]SER70408.1 D-alanyl-lipoteichoic acid acyltransferase DltB, MBOAT superfamily [Gracilibacillus ureilyticus]
MLFNSFEFIFVFLPVMFFGYFICNKIHPTIGKAWLFVGSLFFYSWWNPVYLWLLLASIIINYGFGTFLLKRKKNRKLILTIGIIFNVSLLGFFKYYDFFVSNINFLFDTNYNFLHLILPLAISFYTFQQIAYLVDVYQNKVEENSFLHYALFISFFPQLIAGPIVHHKEVMGQYVDRTNKRMNGENIAKGLFLFSIGLFKKVAIADTFAIWANEGFANSASLTLADGWITSLSYTFQLYFDFSGYSDMAIGLALLFNIRLPINFDSPYKAVSIQDFWRRWHITLSRFLTSYIYIPLGGNRVSVGRTYIHIFIVFFISGFWHGAGWTFIAWGVMHGMAMMVHRLWHQLGLKLPAIVAWFVTFQFINATWVFFRAPDFATALNVLTAMVRFDSVPVTMELFMENSDKLLIYLIGASLLALFVKNSIQWTDRLRPNPVYAAFAACLFIYAALRLQQVSEFLYFNF